MSVEDVDVVVIGGGQAGLAIGYYLARRGLRFVILEAHTRVGDSWRYRWDSLRLFTFARHDALPGMPFPAPPYSFPTKDEMADYLEQYAATFDLPVRTGVDVDALRRAEDGDGYIVIAGDARWLAPQVVIAAGAYHEPRVPDFARELKPEIRQFHSSQYRNPAQLRPGGVLVVGACNSGAEIAFDVAREHHTWLSGRDTGHIPINPGSRAYQVFGHLMSFLGSRLLTVDTPLGRKARPKFRAGGGPLIRVKPVHLRAAGVERVLARTVGTPRRAAPPRRRPRARRGERHLVHRVRTHRPLDRGPDRPGRRLAAAAARRRRFGARPVLHWAAVPALDQLLARRRSGARCRVLGRPDRLSRGGQSVRETRL